MHPDRAAKRTDCSDATDLSKHDCEASDQPDLGQANDARTSRYDVTCLASRKLRTKSNRVSSRAAKTARDLPQGDRSALILCVINCPWVRSLGARSEERRVGKECRSRWS